MCLESSGARNVEQSMEQTGIGDVDFGVLTTRLPMFSLQGGSTRTMNVLASRSRYRFTVDSAMPKARASSAPFQI